MDTTRGFVQKLYVLLCVVLASLPAFAHAHGGTRLLIVESRARPTCASSWRSAALEQTVTVEGATPVLEMTSNVISTHAQQQGVNELPLAGRNAFTLRAARARRRGAAGHRQHALQRHAGRHDQSDDRRRQQLVERLQERRHELLRHGAGPARRGRGSHGRDRRPRRRRRRHRRRQPEVRHAPRHRTSTAAASFEQYRTDKLNANSFSNERPRPAEGRSCAATTSAATSAARSSRAAARATSCSSS